MTLDEWDRRLIAVSRGGLPLVRDPYRQLAEGLGLSTVEVLGRLRRLADRGVIRRVAAIVDQRRVGLTGNVLAAWAVSEGRADGVGEHLAQRPEVTHCYLRAPAPGWPYTLYAMIHGPDLGWCRRFIDELTGQLELPPPVLLPTVRELKRAPPPPPLEQ
jgi:DNA-binding Lrp family transcriptional regulator